MVDKLHEYQGCLGRLHTLRDQCKVRWQEHKDSGESIGDRIRGYLRGDATRAQQQHADYSHIYRRKTRGELVRVSAAVMGIEFSYAAETAFVSPTLLKIGVDHQRMTMVWALSPLVGFFLNPILGAMSDRCRLPCGRRRPFIVLLALGVLIGLILVPNGERMGHALGDFYPSIDLPRNQTTNFDGKHFVSNVSDADYPHPWGIFFTVLGTVLLDFDADACQSPARSYLLDVCVAEDHARGLSTFTIMAGLGGFMGYGLGGINWDDTFIGEMLGGHVRAVFTLITYIFIVCVAYTVTSFKEIPLDLVENEDFLTATKQSVNALDVESQPLQGKKSKYGSTQDPSDPNQEETQFNGIQQQEEEDVSNGHVSSIEGIKPLEPLGVEEVATPSFRQYLMSIIVMPWSMRILCLTNLFCWMAHVCYSLYFTDFVGEAVFNGDPKAPEGTELRELYEEGVRFGCWGMSMYSLSCACYSSIIEKLIRQYKAKKVYVGGLLFYSLGMFLMAALKHKIGVIVFSWTAGVMYSTLFTMPYLLIANYHEQNTFEVNSSGDGVVASQVRGLGTDVAIVSSMVFLAQFSLSICMGSVVSWAGTTTAVAAVAAFLAFCGAISATQVVYLDL
ncbi:proton-associated sugar transporter A isoform X2 [Macrosteles quadrilineatus]|nr:proton-associated sugar transporter A isoform X2 [Macrosteles quadrilineatus]